MDPIEKAIRSAFQKGDPRDRAFREQVYRSAFAALDRAMKANPNTPEDVIARRREAVVAKVTEIESEFVKTRPAGQPQAPSVDAPSNPAGGAAQAPAPEPAFERREPAFDDAPVIEPRERRAQERGGDAGVPAAEGYRRRQPRARGGGSWLMPAIAGTVLLVIGLLAWWAIGGLSGSQGQTDTPSAQTPPPAEQGASQGEDAPPAAVGGADDLADWIVVFEPSDPTTVTAPGDTRAEVLDDEGEQFIRITGGASGSPILFDVGAGVLDEIAGRRAVFNIVAQAQQDQETQFSVECDLAELGDCGRRRFAVGVTREEFLFELELPNASPGAGGTIAINPDVEGSGRSLDIHGIRVSPVQ